MFLQGPHQVAQKSVTTIRLEERIWVKWAGEVMSIIWDIVRVLGGCWVGGEVECAWIGERWRSVVLESLVLFDV